MSIEEIDKRVSDAANIASAERAKVTQFATKEEGWISRHAEQIFWSALIVVVALALWGAKHLFGFLIRHL